jgi:hypothetical protein
MGDKYVIQSNDKLLVPVAIAYQKIFLLFLQNQCILSILFRVNTVETVNTYLDDGRCQRI